MKKTKLSLLAATIAASHLLLTAHAAPLPSLGLNVEPFTSTPPAAAFSGGITLNGGANFLNTVPAGQPAGILATITPASAHVGTQASLYLVAYANATYYMYTQAGFVVWNGDPASL